MNTEYINKVAIIGTGTMGAGIGLCFARAGFSVRLYDIKQKQLDIGTERVHNKLNLLVNEGLISETDKAATLSDIEMGTDLGRAVRAVDFVLEAVPEVLELKQKIFFETGRQPSITAR